MFLRAHGRQKDGKNHTYWSLVETVRTPDGPRQRTVCYLGELNDKPRWVAIRAGRCPGGARPSTHAARVRKKTERYCPSER